MSLFKATTIRAHNCLIQPGQGATITQRPQVLKGHNYSKGHKRQYYSMGMTTQGPQSPNGHSYSTGPTISMGHTIPKAIFSQGPQSLKGHKRHSYFRATATQAPHVLSVICKEFSACEFALVWCKRVGPGGRERPSDGLGGSRGAPSAPTCCHSLQFPLRHLVLCANVLTSIYPTY